MNIKEIYNHFEKIGSVVFATIDNGLPETRIAHFFAEDEEGLYFRTMITKPFYHQLKSTGKVSVCGMNAKTEIEHDEEGLPLFEGGYSIRVSGECEEVPFEYIEEKAKTSKDFMLGYKDILKYPALRAFVLKKGRGEVFDFDFEKENRDYKLQRTRFTFNGYEYPLRGLFVNENCINCGLCEKACSFDAITKGSIRYHINQDRCDACGDCTIACKFDAIDVITD